jgi:hypothetical protein
MGHVGDVFHGDHRNAAAHLLDGEACRGRLPRLHRRYRAFDPSRRVPRFRALADLDEFHPQLVARSRTGAPQIVVITPGGKSIGVSSSAVMPKPIDLPVNS